MKYFANYTGYWSLVRHLAQVLENNLQELPSETDRQLDTSSKLVVDITLTVKEGGTINYGLEEVHVCKKIYEVEVKHIKFSGVLL